MGEWESVAIDPVWSDALHQSAPRHLLTMLLDPVIDTTPKRPKLIVMDFTAAESDDLVELHRFNALDLHLYEFAPTHLRPNQVPDPAATTYMVATEAVLRCLFDNWEPVNSCAFSFFCAMTGHG